MKNITKQDNEKGSVDKVKEEFIKILGKYFKEKVTLKKLSNLCIQLYFEQGLEKELEEKDLKLARMIYWAGEARYYYKKDRERYKRIMSDLEKYYKGQETSS